MTTAVGAGGSAPHDRRRVAITGASGFVGRAIERFLTTAGYSVVRISRSPPRPGTADVSWAPDRGELDASRLEGLDGVVHLAGESIARRWTRGARERILHSRVAGTSLLARTLSSLDSPPPVLVSASAVGYYGDSGDREVTEESAPGPGFLSEVTRAWEDAARPAAESGIRVVHPRFGMVLGEGGGALDRLLPVFRMGIGGKLGDGRQWMSWVALGDVVRALDLLLHDPALSGPVNVVAPQAVTNAVFTATLGRVLHRPAIMTVPGAVLRMVYGQMADETLLTGQRVSPLRLTSAGFVFRFPDLEGALRAELGARERAGG